MDKQKNERNRKQEFVVLFVVICLALFLIAVVGSSEPEPVFTNLIGGF